jgi:hypothetical protein
VFFMLGTFMTASAFSTAANAPGLRINPLWGTVGIARRAASKNYAPGSNGKRLAPSRSGPEGCTSGHIDESWASLPTTRLFESRGRATLEKTGRISTALVCGGSAEAGLPRSVDGRSANHRRRQNHAPN